MNENGKTIEEPKNLFISYSRIDKDTIDKITNHLQGQGIELWLDKSDLDPMDKWVTEIEKALKNCYAVCAMVSPDSLESKWVIREWLFADDLRKPLIPFIIREVELIPLVLKDSQALFYYLESEQSLERLVAALKSNSSPQPALASFISIPPKVLDVSSLVQDNRSAVLGKMRNRVQGELKNLLGLPSVIPLRRSWHHDIQQAKLTGTDIALLQQHVTHYDIFKTSNGQLLIVGGKGTGKTHVLLELASDLIAAAEQSETNPIPFIFYLKSWANERHSIEDWMISELEAHYLCPETQSRDWITSYQILPLFDGLDEVPHHYREQCVREIKRFLTKYLRTRFVMTCIIQDFKALQTRFEVPGIYLHLLESKDIVTYLRGQGEKWQLLADAIADGIIPVHYLQNPLNLSITVLAAEELIERFSQDTPQSTSTKPDSQSFKELKLAWLYAQHMFERAKITPPEQSNAEKWLQKLALQMREQNQEVFLIEALQPSWLEDSADRLKYAFIFNMLHVPMGLILVGGIELVLGGFAVGFPLGLAGAVIGGILHHKRVVNTRFERNVNKIFSLLFGEIADDFEPENKAGLVADIFGVFFAGIAAILLYPSDDPRLPGAIIIAFLTSAMFGAALESFITFTNDTQRIGSGRVIRWSFKRFGQQLRQRAWFIILPALLTLFIPVVNLLNNSIVTLIYTPGIVALTLLLAGIAGGVYSEKVETGDVPNYGMRQSLKNALIWGLWLALIAGFVVGILGYYLHGINLGVIMGVVAAVVLFAAGSLAYGGFTVMKHTALRLTLFMTGQAPPLYERYLDRAASWGFMHKVGGGYRFVHETIQEYFANLQSQRRR